MAFKTFWRRVLCGVSAVFSQFFCVNAIMVQLVNSLHGAKEDQITFIIDFMQLRFIIRTEASGGKKHELCTSKSTQKGLAHRLGQATSAVTNHVR